MADSTSLPALRHFRWSRTDAPRPTLATGIDSDDTTIVFSSAPKDEDGTVIADHFILGIKKLTGSERGFVELIYVPAGGLSADGLTATGVTRGIEPSGLDYTTTNTDFATSFDAGSPVFCAVAAVEAEMITSTLQGTISTGANNFRIGDNATDSDITLYAQNSDTNKPFLRYDAGNSQWEFSNDGSSTAAIGTAAGSITGGDGITVTSGDIDIDLTDTTIFVQTSSGASDSGKVVRVEADGFFDLDFLGTTATLTAAKLDTLIDGSNADSLHVHATPTVSLVVAEDVTADQAVAVLPIEVEYFSQLTEAFIALGDANARRRYAVKFTPTATSSSLTTMQIRGRENGASTMTLTVSIQGDNSGEPDGSAITNGTANTIDTSLWTATSANRTVTWASSPTLTAGTSYWLVFEVDGTDAANYVEISVNSSHDENYVTFTRLEYDLDTGTWGGSVTNATPWFWTDSEVKLLGVGVVPCDANWGARTWNFVGIAKTTVSANSSVDIYYDIVPDLSNLVPGEEYYISTTAGDLTIIAPGTAVHNAAAEPSTFAYKVGRAISTTNLKIELGTKRVICRETTDLTATTTRNYITWFKPEFVRTYGVGDGSNDSAVSMGYVTSGGADASVNMNYVNSAAGTSEGSISLSLNLKGDGSDKFAGAGSAFTDAGFTYTYTETGTANMAAILEAIK